METWPEVDAMRLRDVTAYGKSHTKCLSFPFNIWDISLISLSFSCAYLANLHIPCVTYLDSFSILVFKALVLCVDLQSEHWVIFSPTFSLTHLSKSSQFAFSGVLELPLLFSDFLSIPPRHPVFLLSILFCSWAHNLKLGTKSWRGHSYKLRPSPHLSTRYRSSVFHFLLEFM